MRVSFVDMRPLFHPSIDDVTVEGILHALSDPVRVAIYAQIVGANCPQICSNFLKISEKSIPKSTLSQHFKALREAGLIRGERRGVEMHNTSRCEELEKRFPGLIKAIVNAHAVQVGRHGDKEKGSQGDGMEAVVLATKARRKTLNVKQDHRKG